MVNLNLTGVRFHSTEVSFGLTTERLSLTAVNLDLTGVRFHSIRVRFNLTRRGAYCIPEGPLGTRRTFHTLLGSSSVMRIVPGCIRGS